MAAWDLIIFDNDGVLVDSEPIANEVLAALLTSLGYPTTPDDSINRFLGHSIQQVRRIVESPGHPLPVDFADRYHSAVFDRFRAELRPVPGVADVIRTIDGDRCVASSGSHERIRLALTTVGLLDEFDGAIYSAADVDHGKPAPDLFLHAAGRRHARPRRCVVVEDSPAGVTAGRAAGMTVLGFAARTPADRLQHADAVFDDMAALTALLDRLA